MDYIAENKIIKCARAKETKTGTRTVNIMFHFDFCKNS